MADAPRTWVLTSAPDNHAATAAHGFTVIGMKQRRRNQALMMEPGDRIVLSQGQLCTVSDADAALLMERMHAAAGVAA